MKIGVIAAMDLELKPFLDFFTIEKIFTFSKNKFYTSTHNEHKIIMICSGQGKTNSAVYTQLLIQNFNVDLVINVGICGGISENTNILDLFVGEKYVHYDIRKKQSLNKFPRQLYYLGDRNAINQFLINNNEVKKGTFGTGEGFITDRDSKQILIQEFNIDCVDMESAAIAQTCFLNNTRFISLRVVSDKADENASTTTDNYQSDAMNKVFTVIQNFLININ